MSGVKVSAEKFLNGLVLTLLARSRQDPVDRPARLGNLLVADTPDEAEVILDAPDLYAKNFGLLTALGPSRITQNGAAWTALRPRTQQAYARAGRPVMEPGVRQIYDEELARAAPDARGIETALSRAALRVFFAAFGLAPDIGPFLAHFFGLRRVVAELQYVSSDGGTEIDIASGRTKGAEMIRQFTAACTAEPPVLAAIQRLAAQSPTVPLPAMLADFMTNMYAAIESTSANLAWMVDAMGRNESLQDALRQEALDGEGSLLASFRDECLRVFTPVPFVIREVTVATRLGRHELQPGNLVLLSIVGLHRTPEFWTNPHEFHAARAEFAPGAPPNPAFRPFLSGPRACGGRRIAEMELTVALRLLVTRFRFASPEAFPAFTYAIAFRPVLTPEHRVSRV